MAVVALVNPMCIENKKLKSRLKNLDSVIMGHEKNIRVLEGKPNLELEELAWQHEDEIVDLESKISHLHDMDTMQDENINTLRRQKWALQREIKALKGNHDG